MTDLMDFLAALPLVGNGLAACLVCAILGAVLGIHVILRRIVFVSAAISQISSLGLALALFVPAIVGFSQSLPEAGTPSLLNVPGLAVVTLTLAAAGLFAMRSSERRIPRESVIGIAYVLSAGLVLLILDRLSGETHLLDTMLFGNTVFVSTPQLILLTVVAAGLLGVHALCFNAFISIAFDRETAGAAGLPVRVYELIFYATLALALVTAVSSIGMLPVFGYMVMPAATALMMTDRIRLAVALAVMVGLLSALLGFYASFVYDLPTGPAMLAVAGIMMLPGIVFRKR
ncbi:High-affinity zinc uptake system membrane protein ZnuB [compost metagenome]